jgi:heme exporter protein D
MELGTHLSFVVAAYTTAGAIVALLIGWVILDHRALKHTIAAFEGRGVTRRSNQPAKTAT